MPTLRPLALCLLLLVTGCSPYRDGMGAVLTGEAFDNERQYDVPYVPTPDAVVDAMLDMAAIQRGERMVDLGSGDGRIAIAAARRGAQATGIEIDGGLVQRARYRAATAGVTGVQFRQQNLFTVPLSDVDVVTLYLLPRINQQLRPRLLTEARAGTRIVSHAFDMGDWRFDEHRLVEDKHVYLWIVPATAGGDWRVDLGGGRTARLVLAQRYQDVTGTLDGQPLTDVTLRGRALRFTAGGRVWQGIVGDAAIDVDPAAPAGTVRGWRAVRADG